MLNKIAYKIANKLLANKAIKEEVLDIYVYGLELLLSSIFSAGVIITIGTLLGRFPETVAFLITFSVLRSFTGGYHANSYWKCSVITLSVFGIVIILSEIISVQLFWYGILTIIGILLLLIFAPVDNPNKRLTVEQKSKFKIVSLGVFAVIITIGLCLNLIHSNINDVIFFALIADIFLLFIKNPKERRIKHEAR